MCSCFVVRVCGAVPLVSVPVCLAVPVAPGLPSIVEQPTLSQEASEPKVWLRTTAAKRKQWVMMIRGILLQGLKCPGLAVLEDLLLAWGPGLGCCRETAGLGEVAGLLLDGSYCPLLLSHVGTNDTDKGNLEQARVIV